MLLERSHKETLMRFGIIVHLPGNLSGNTVADFIKSLQKFAVQGVVIERLVPQRGQHKAVLIKSDSYIKLIDAYGYVLDEAAAKDWRNLETEQIGNV